MQQLSATVSALQTFYFLERATNTRRTILTGGNYGSGGGREERRTRRDVAHEISMHIMTSSQNGGAVVDWGMQLAGKRNCTQQPVASPSSTANSPDMGRAEGAWR